MVGTCVRYAVGCAASALALGCGADVFSTGTDDGGAQPGTDASVVAVDASVTDAPVADARPLDGAPDAQVGPCPGKTTIQLPAEADAFLLETYPTYAVGKVSMLHAADYGQALARVAIMRFNLSTLPGGAKIRDLTLGLSYAPVSSNCGGPCASCAGVEVSGPIDAFFLRSDWDESTVTWQSRGPNKLWDKPGAVGQNDRSSPPFASFAHVAKQNETIALSQQAVNDINNWVSQSSAGPTVSVLLGAQPNSAAKFVIASREWQADCGGDAGLSSAPTLTVTYCQ